MKNILHPLCSFGFTIRTVSNGNYYGCIMHTLGNIFDNLSFLLIAVHDTHRRRPSSSNNNKIQAQSNITYFAISSLIRKIPLKCSLIDEMIINQYCNCRWTSSQWKWSVFSFSIHHADNMWKGVEWWISIMYGGAKSTLILIIDIWCIIFDWIFRISDQMIWLPLPPWIYNWISIDKIIIFCVQKSQCSSKYMVHNTLQSDPPRPIYTLFTKSACTLWTPLFIRFCSGTTPPTHLIFSHNPVLFIRHT